MPLAIAPRPASFSLPLAPYEAHVIADATDASGDAFLIQAGLTKDQVAELTEKSADASDAELREHTSDARRFAEGAFEAWYEAKKRFMLPLIHAKTGAIAALVWAGPDVPPPVLGEDGAKGLHTVAFRSYRPFRGTGLMSDFARFALSAYEERHPGARWWLRVQSGNEAGKRLYSKLGFAPRGLENEGATLVMTRG
jgi:hypothetical protein